MAIQKISNEGITHPFGDHRSVKQAFPAGISSKESDPFLMCDYFGMKEQTGKARHEDDFPIGWHPHRGFDIASYLKTGVGRHGDSLGNRETFATPGMQWMSVGSGVEHAEGGANEKGTLVQGFQIWINVPSEHKMDDPDYGTVGDEDMPVLSIGTKEKSRARILAGPAFGNNDETSTTTTSTRGPFRTKQEVQMIDFELQPGDRFDFEIANDLDTALLYVYEGALLEPVHGDDEVTTTTTTTTTPPTNANPKQPLLDRGSIVLFDATSNDRRTISLATAPDQTASVMLFAGKKLREPIAWRGPIVMNTQEQIRETFRDMRNGSFPPKRVDWDYKKHKSRPPAVV